MPDEIVFESPADQAGFTMLPNVVLLDDSLTIQARLLYALFIHYARQKKSCYPGQGTIAEILKVTDRSVRTYIAELEKAMLVRREQRGRGHTCRYIMLALGLRAKRLEKGKSVDNGASPENDFRRKPASAQPGSLFPAEEDAEEEDAGRSVRAGGRGKKKLRVNGDPVKAELWTITEGALAAWNELAAQEISLLNGKGEPSEMAKRIYRRVEAWPALTVEQHRDIIERTLMSKWWGDDKPAPGVVYGPKVFEENMTRQPTPKQAKDAGRKVRAKRGIAAIQRIIDQKEQG